jgi:hypothetical protein
MRAADPAGGLDNGIARHKLHGDALLKGIQAMGLETFGDLKHKMNNVLGVVIPQGVNGDQVRKLMLEDFGIEIGTSFGPLHGKVWRIGTMGYNARKDCVMTTLSALESVLNYLKFPPPRARRCRPRGITIAARAPNESSTRQQAEMQQAAARVMARADELAAISETPDALTRVYLSRSICRPTSGWRGG